MHNFNRLKLGTWVAAAVMGQLALLSLTGAWQAATTAFGALPAGALNLAGSGVGVPAQVLVAAVLSLAVVLCMRVADWAKGLQQTFMYKDYIHAFR